MTLVGCPSNLISLEIVGWTKSSAFAMARATTGDRNRAKLTLFNKPV